MVVYYRNSLLASLVSILGCILCLSGIYAAIEGEFEALSLLIVGVPIVIWGKIISKNKEFKKWWQEIEENNLVPQIASSVDTAALIYSKNPDKRTLKKIEELNPAAAQCIKTSIEANKANKNKK